MRIVVVGGGYSGLACLLELRRRMRDAELILLDPGANHLKITHLHETLRKPLQQYQSSFVELGRRHNFRHLFYNFDFDDLGSIAERSELVVAGQSLSFDYLVLATGAQPPELPKNEFVFDRDDLRQRDAGEILNAYLDDDSRCKEVTVVGGGPSGIQVLFELTHLARTRGHAIQFRLIDRAATLLEELPPAIGSYVSSKLENENVQYMPETEYRSVEVEKLLLREVSSGREFSARSGLTFLFPGVRANPQLHSNQFGQLEKFDNIYAAGDCVKYDARGDDQLTAQVAVRQGKLVARNIDRHSRGARPLEYYFKELGYVVSLGPMDAVGWLLSKNNIVDGLPAFAIKEVIEAQYDLFVAGLDTYII